MSLTKEQIEILKNWEPTQWPNRAYRWAQFKFPMKEPEYREGMSESTIKYINRNSPKYRLFANGKKGVISYDKLVAANKKEYLQFCADNKLILTAYDRAL